MLLAALLTATSAWAGDAYWQDYSVDGRAGLAYVPDESDAFGLELTCRPGGVGISVPVGEGTGGGRLRLASGAVVQIYRVRYEDDEEMGRFAEAVLPVGDAVLANFRRTGRISVDGSPLDASSPAERTAIETFFHRCDGLAKRR